MKHTANKKQTEAFEALVKAFKRCKNTGLVLYAKSEFVVAYTKQADEYVEKKHGFETCLASCNGQIPCLSANVLADSGADDYASYVSEEDKLRFDP